MATKKKSNAGRKSITDGTKLVPIRVFVYEKHETAALAAITKLSARYRR